MNNRVAWLVLGMVYACTAGSGDASGQVMITMPPSYQDSKTLEPAPQPERWVLRPSDPAPGPEVAAFNKLVMRFDAPGTTREELLKECEAFLNAYANEKSELDVVYLAKSMRDGLVQLIKNGVPAATDAQTMEKMSVAERVKYLIARLPEVRGREYSREREEYARMEDTEVLYGPDSEVQSLVNIGLDARCQLIR